MKRRTWRPAGPPREFLGYIVTETIRAFFFQSWYWKEPLWMPKSQVTVDWGDYEVKLIATDWICGQNEIEEDVCDA